MPNLIIQSGLDDAITHALVKAQTTGSGIQLPKLVLQEFC
jgi:hypothetical protein